MAMRRDVKRHSIVIIVFALVQWAIVMAALNFNWWHLDQNGRILTFCFSVFGGAWLLMCAILYMVIKGRDHSKEDNAK
ncbi:hypothetical protein GCM10023206_33750 [Acinetobacter puyangensis]|uniref:Uncharacterized protein n=1 Tax=Acinetobacter puyangensis TaxID=1096779 RepID=A0A240EE85_9GAMM|nr:hypothetical protein [Acinetobacter puyangensis]SNX46499.1 hypothetical protein SAMN05421731_11268 [Acinetobacter puyangensis]